jgi:ATP-binding cassette, subfamily B, bacterial HlyB/CyaB
MAQICRGRTVFVIAHRLSAVARAHRIIVLDKGAIIESGSHAELLANQSGLYSTLWRLQDASLRAEASA